jgi:predicted DCC family thiol-disulfide oxidoreductase YuxK
VDYLFLECRAMSEKPSSAQRPPTPRPVVVFDGECQLCAAWVERVRQSGEIHPECVPYQDASVRARFPSLTQERMEGSLHLIDAEGHIHRGAEAILQAAGNGRLWTVLRRLYERSPAFASAAELAYRWVARNRRTLSRALGRRKRRA